MKLFQNKWLNFPESKSFFIIFYISLIISASISSLLFYSLPYNSISKESIIDILVKIVPVTAKIEFCTEQNLELSILEIYVVSAAKPQLPLQIEDASRPEKDDVNFTNVLSLS